MRNGSNSCRACGSSALSDPLLILKNQPRGAQSFVLEAELFSDYGIHLVVIQCSACGLVQLDAEPVSYYREVIRSAGISSIIREEKLDQFSSFISRHGLQGKRVIEFGCGRGEFLSVLAELEVDAYGLEASQKSVEECLLKGLKVSCGYPEDDLQLPYDHQFDAFVLLMFLEHMPNPGSSLAAIRRHLAEDAVGLIEVPNLEMVLQRGLISEFTIDHLLYFTSESLNTLLATHGFTILSSRFNRADYVLSVEVKRRSFACLDSMKIYENRIIGQIIDFIKSFDTVAIWGAGHQALCIMCLAELGLKIRYVVDSAPSKQGTYTPVTHIPIVSPERLRTDPVDAVLIMGGSYSDEIVTILNNSNLSLRGKAVLRESGVELVGQQQQSR